MIMSASFRRILNLLILAWAGLQTPSASGARLVDEYFSVLQTRTGTYTNVTVTTKAENYIFIHHTNGLVNIRLADLPIDVRQELGYVVAEAPKPQRTNVLATVAARQLTQVNRNLKPVEDALKHRWDQRRAAAGRDFLILFLGAGFLVYLFFCYCFHLICFKAKSPTSLLIWVPGLQWLPLLRAAGMSGWWFLGMCVPFLNIAAYVLWCLNIVKAREKNVVWAILLILPITSIIGIVYLAFSDSPAAETPSAKFQTRALQTA